MSDQPITTTYTCDTCQTTAKIRLDLESNAVSVEPCLCVVLEQATNRTADKETN